MNIWEWMVSKGLISGTPSWYTSGMAQKFEYEHAFKVAIQTLESNPQHKAEFWNRLVQEDFIQGDANWWATGNPNADDIKHAINVATNYGYGTQGAGVTAGSGGSVMQGGQTIRVHTTDGHTRFYQVYEFPPGSDNYVSYQFNNEAQAKQVLGANFNVTSRSESWFNTKVLAEGKAEEVFNRTGTWGQYTREIMNDAAQAAGVRDPALAGRIASNPEMQKIMAQAIIGGWTQQQILAEQRNTNFWKNELYPGIEAFYGRTTSPESAWMNYVGEVTPALRALGYDTDADGTFNTSIKRMLDSKIDADTFISQVPTFIQATQNAEFAGIFNQWASAELGRTVDFNDWFDLMAGEGRPDLEAVSEKAQLAYQAQARGAQITDQQVRDLADRTQLSQAQMAGTFADFNEAILALGEAGLERGGLSRDEVLAAAAGVSSLSGRSVEEIKLQVAKLARENALFDDEKINLYVGFDQQGRPTRPGLQSLRPEGG